MKNSWVAVFIPKIEILVPSISVVTELRRRGVVIYRVRSHEEGVIVLISSAHKELLEIYPLIRRQSIYGVLLKLILPVFSVVIALMILMGMFTINYEIKGNLTENEVKDLDELLDEHFYNVGPFAFLKTSEEAISTTLQEHFNEFVWTNVYKRGTDIVIDLYDIEGVSDDELFGLTDTLYAKRSGVVQDYVVDTCRVLVARNQFVEMGDPLVTCYVEHPYTTELIEMDETPSGEVYADTWYEVTIRAQKKYEEETFTTDTTTRYTLQLGDYSLTLPFDDIPYEAFDVTAKTLDPFFFMKESPLYLQKQKYYEKRDIIKENTYEDILANLEVLVEQAFVNYTDSDFVIKEMTILSEEETEDELIFRCHLTVYENIAY